jgi:hypothetical protein
LPGPTGPTGPTGAGATYFFSGMMLNIDTTVSDNKYFAASGVDDAYGSNQLDVFIEGPTTSCTAGNLSVRLNSIINDGTLSFTLGQGNTDTTLTCTIDSSSGAPGNFLCADYSNNPVINGPYLWIKVTSSSADSSAPTSVNAGFSWECVP